MGCAQSQLQDKGAAGGLSDVRPQIDTDEAAQAAALVNGSSEADYTSLVEISISCRHLPKMDIASKSDPMVVLYQTKWGYSNWEEVARSDIIMNNHDPDFTRPIRVRYTFETLQPLKVVVYDVDSSGKLTPEMLDLSKQDYIGEAEFLLSDLMTAPSQKLQKPLASVLAGRRLPEGCTVLFKAEELANTNATVRLTFSASNLENKERFSKSDPFLRVLKLREGGEWVPVLKTEVIDNNLNPAWRPLEVDMRQLCNGDEQRPLKLEVFDYENNGSHKFIGECQTSLADLRAAMTSGTTLPLVNPTKLGKGSYRNSGVLLVPEATVMYRPSFLQYITGGCQLNFMVAIDFTGSNGDPRERSSLHFLSPKPTMYEEAVKAVGQVLEKYDTDKQYPVWGFGAALPPAGTVSHCFAVGGTPEQPEVSGIDGILKAYRKCLPNIKLSGPTLFAPVINAAAAIAKEATESPGLSYYVLLILTDGCIMDMAQTAHAIVEASRLPLSLLIVGVGDADFSAMDVLDGDDTPLASNGRVTARDIVQFVPLKRTQRSGGAAAVAKELLAEIPGQVVGYFHDLRGMPPPFVPPNPHRL